MMESILNPPAWVQILLTLIVTVCWYYEMYKHQEYKKKFRLSTAKNIVFQCFAAGMANEIDTQIKKDQLNEDELTDMLKSCFRKVNLMVEADFYKSTGSALKEEFKTCEEVSEFLKETDANLDDWSFGIYPDGNNGA